ncbi:MAG: monofunctional biosynthetic peptidoglycan transglycosylase [Bacteroidales bacterium]|nr:monofunctional biosynthetic peptidoglycan transglycosylase [Bacteroidales bacterium]MBQ9174886.1 monofunctional biosynthetic peptidoglycan transglycosylase [Bacteroidales bacterium]MBQ9711531.1 monofunctional biosynthetic peptidoglycan transglycosylase [Bacteroidales bacterium]
MKRRSPAYWIFIRIPLWFIAASLALVLSLKWIPVGVTPLMVTQSVKHIGDDSFSIKKKWVPLRKISPEAVKAVIAGEDNRFNEHRGFDWIEMKKMWEDHNERGKKIRGCSTISQQTAKNVFTFGSSTTIRKIYEAWWTFLIEKIWGKKRIMEVYLNVAETGRGIFGVEAAAREYWDTSAAALTRRQACQIAASLPSPLKRNPAAGSGYASRRASDIQSLIGKIGYPSWIEEKCAKKGK